MIAIAIGMFVLAYFIGGLFTVREYIYVYEFRALTLSEVGSIVVIFFLWPLALAYWRMIR